MKTDHHGRCTTILLVLIFALCFLHETARAGPFVDGRLYLHSQGALAFTSDCEGATTSVELTDEPTTLYVIADFPNPSPARLKWISFGVEYDPSRIEIVNQGFLADVYAEQGDWPMPGSGVRLEWIQDRIGHQIEIGWFRSQPNGESSAEVRLVPGPFGGNFGDFIFHEPIDGYGSFGFGIDGELECAIEETCCLENGQCALRTEYWCKRADGAYLGDQPCEACNDVGACCVDWMCRVTLEADCTDDGSTWLGGETVCEPNECIPLGSCCLPDGECRIVRENECNGLGGGFVGDPDCEVDPCVSLGACCHFDWRVCQLTTEEDCTNAGSTYHGDATVCTPNLCPPGLCCFGEISDCRYTDEAECLELEGFFNPGAHGPIPQACDYVCCCGPVEKTSWGQIKRRFKESIPSRQ